MTDIEKELKHYDQHFKGKTVYCNCDDPKASNFSKYFLLNFKAFGLKKLIMTCYKNQASDLFSRHDSERSIGLIYAERERERERERESNSHDEQNKAQTDCSFNFFDTHIQLYKIEARYKSNCFREDAGWNSYDD